MSRQKGKHMKRRRAWHHGKGQDWRWLKAVRKIKRALDGSNEGG